MSGGTSRRSARFLSTLSLRRATIPVWLLFKLKEVFLSTLSLRRATKTDGVSKPVILDFYPRSPCGERPVPSGGETSQGYFYPRSPCGERHPRKTRTSAKKYFYPRSPCGERPSRTVLLTFAFCNFYPRSPCGERPNFPGQPLVDVSISIHALLAESDVGCHPHAPLITQFLSTLSLRRATPVPYSITDIRKFLSTLSLRRATSYSQHVKWPSGYFYPRSPCGERLNEVLSLVHVSVISIHALLAESDTGPGPCLGISALFLSTLSLRRATDQGTLRSGTLRHFYPRSPCGERPRCVACQMPWAWHFYPRSPCGERPWKMARASTCTRFLSTLSLRRATAVR